MRDDLIHDPREAAQQIVKRLQASAPSFHIFRTILKRPSWYAEVVGNLMAARADVAIVDPYTFMALVKRHSESTAEHAEVAESSRQEVLRGRSKE